MSQAGGAAAFGAQAIDFQAMSRHAEAMFGGDDVQGPRQGRILEFDQGAALAANQVVVLRVAVIVFVDFTVMTAGDFAQQSRENHVVEGAIDGGAADSLAVGAGRELAHKLIGVEMLVRREHLGDDGLAFASQALSAGGQIFTEFIRRSGSHRNRRKLAHHLPRVIVSRLKKGDKHLATPVIPELVTCRSEPVPFSNRLPNGRQVSIDRPCD